MSVTIACSLYSTICGILLLSICLQCLVGKSPDMLLPSKKSVTQHTYLWSTTFFPQACSPGHQVNISGRLFMPPFSTYNMSGIGI